ncbi:MAG: hypothetical protein NC419_06365 [Muribaculaceae bacterium]|nr:hypothetical protein [Muribaculaceae bacterium]
MKRILAMLLTTCMIVESTATVSAVGAGQAEENVIVPMQENAEAADGAESAAKDTIGESPEEKSNGNNGESLEGKTEENNGESLEGKTEEDNGESLEEKPDENNGESLEEKTEEDKEEPTAGSGESETGNEAPVEEDTADLEDAGNPADLEDALAGEETENDGKEIETKEAEPVAQPERHIRQETYAVGRAASSAEVREINLGFYGMSDPKTADGTSYWKGSRVSFGEIRSEMAVPGNLGIDKKIYANTWKVLDAEQGLLWADVNESVDGINASSPWQSCDLYAYLNGDYKQKENYFKDTDRQAIREITLLSAAQLRNTAYGFTDSAAADNARRNGGTDNDSNLLLPEEADKLTFVNTEGEIWEYTDAGSISKEYYYIPALYLDTSRVLYSMLNGTTEKYDSGKFTIVENLEESDMSSWELALKSDDNGFAANLPDSIPVGGALSVQVTSKGSGDYRYTVAMLTDSNGTVAAYARNGTVGGTVQFNLPAGFTAGSYHLTVFEESEKSSSPWGAASSYTSNVIEKDVEVSGMGITDFQVSEQTYGSIRLYWELANVTEFGQVSCKIYRSETADGDYTLVDTIPCSWGTLAHLDPCYVWEDTNVQRAEGTKNKTYYYKICIVNEDGTEGARTDAVTNADMYYGIIRTETTKYDYIGGYIMDAQGQKLEEVNLHQGESQELHLAWVQKDGTAKALDKNSRNSAKWYLLKEYCTTKQLEDYDNPPKAADNVQIIPAEFAEPNDSYIDFVNYKVKIKDFSGAVGDTYYLTVSMYEGEENESGFCYWQIPVHIVAGEGPVEESGEVLTYRTKSEFAQDVRDEMVNRTEEFTFLVKEGEDEDWWIARADGEDEYGDIWDFYQERKDMKPNEGDYLNLTRGKAGAVSFFDEWLTVGSAYFDSTGTFYRKYVFTPHFITTKEQEDWVDEQIDKIIWQPGGALYNYRTASDFNKIRAAYNYVKNNVGYKGTPDPIYHTCYSALKNKVATCQGYALLFYRLARELGIHNRVLMGTDANAHTYNIVQLENAWYYLDTSAGVFLQGENEFNHTDLQSHYKTDTFKQEYLSKISKTSYAGSADIPTSGISGMETLKDAQIKAIDDNIVSADNMSAEYTIGNGSIKASGTIKYTEGCSGYLGYEEGSATAGHFLAVRIKVDASKFTDAGHLSIFYPGKDGKQVGKRYQKTDGSTLKDGYVDVILNVTGQSPDITIEVDYDTNVEDNSKYEATSYLLDLSKLKKEEQGKCAGNVTEVSIYGIENSSPSVQKSKDGTEIRVSYDAVAYSSNVEMYGKEPTSGNYVALRLNTPDCVKPTAMLEDTKVKESTAKDNTTEDSGTEGGTTEGGAAETAASKAAETDCLIEIDEKDYSYIQFIIPMQDTFSKEFTITWGGSHKYAWEQKLVIETSEDCILEKLDENALLPGSIAFNGLNTTMYVGQSQCIHTTIKKKYEQDVTQLFYTSNASDIVSVNRVTGVLKALKPGTAEISVSAIDKSGNTITKTAKITVKALTAPAGIKVSALKDTSAVLNWKANATGQYMEVYAIPYSADVFGTKKADWKGVIEGVLETAGMDGQLLSVLGDDKKTAMLDVLQKYFKTGKCLAESVTSDKKNLTIQGLQAETEYIFYFRNASAATASSVAFAGATSDKVKTKGRIFATVQLTVTPQEAAGITQKTEGDTPVYTITAAGQSTPVTISYTLLDEEGKAITGSAPAFQSVKFNSSNKKIAKVDALSSDKTKGTLSYGVQVGDTEITVTGKDASGTVRTSAPVIVRVVKAPSKLTNKTTTLTIGQSVRLGELIGTDIKGSLQGMELSGVNFDAALQSIRQSNCFASSQKEGEAVTQDTEITAIALIGNKNNGSIDVAFSMGASTATAKIKVKDMAAPSIGKVTLKDTSATISFTPAATVQEQSESKYYTVAITDKATGETLDARNTAETNTTSPDTASPYTCSFSADSRSCKVEGLSSNKTYEAVITAHFDMGKKKNTKSSKAKKFTTKKPLLVTEGSIDVNYISLEELRTNPNAAGTAIAYGNEDGISIENNGTYVFMAQVSNLARTLDTDKLKWTISSGDKKAASIKAASSTFEMQLTTTKTGTFTITATSTVTKEAVATFKVNVIPYQSGGRKTAQDNPAPAEVAYFPTADGGMSRKKEDIA